MPRSKTNPSLPHDKPTDVRPMLAALQCRRSAVLNLLMSLPFSLSRSENHCRRCDRIREEPARCDNPDDVLPLRLCADGPSNLYGRPHAKVYKELSR